VRGRRGQAQGPAQCTPSAVAAKDGNRANVHMGNMLLKTSWEETPCGRGLHSFPLPLNLSFPCPFPLNLSLHCPPCNPT